MKADRTGDTSLPGRIDRIFEKGLIIAWSRMMGRKSSTVGSSPDFGIEVMNVLVESAGSISRTILDGLNYLDYLDFSRLPVFLIEEDQRSFRTRILVLGQIPLPFCYLFKELYVKVPRTTNISVALQWSSKVLRICKKWIVWRCSSFFPCQCYSSDNFWCSDLVEAQHKWKS